MVHIQEEDGKLIKPC